MTRMLLTALALALGLPVLASAQDKPKSANVLRCEERTKAAGDFFGAALCSELNTMSIDPVPESPAFAILNVTPKQVIRPTTPRQFGAALLSGADPNGNFQNGFALDANPYMVFRGSELSLEEYQGNNVARILANTQLSLATTKADSGDDQSTRTAIGLHIMLFNDADPRSNKDHLECIYPSLLDAVKGAPPKPSQAAKRVKELQESEAELTKRAKDCHEKFRLESWSASSWSLGMAGIGNSPDGKTDNMRYGGAGAWTSLALDLSKGRRADETRGQIVLHARWRDNEFVADPANKGKQVRQDTAIVAGELRLGTADFNVSLEPAFLHSTVKGRGTENYFQFTAAAEVRIPDTNFWFTLSAGGTTERDLTGNSAFVLGKLKYGFDQKQDARKPASN